jgi:cell division protein FtsQ
VPALSHGADEGLWRWRLQRLWRRRSVRRAATVQLPALALAGLAAVVFSDPATHAALGERAAALRAALTTRPEFAIRRIEIEGASPAVRGEIMAGLTDAMGASSLALDAAAVRRRVESLGWVASARVSLEAPEALRVVVRERVAAAVWRIEGEPWLIDAVGARIEPAFSRADHPDLPLVVGPGADAAVAEALAILAVAYPLAPRIRGLVRVGKRRWDVALDRGMTLMLPAEEAVAAMERAVLLHDAVNLFERDIAAVDLRLPDRPIVRLTERGLAALNAARARAQGAAGAGRPRT